VQSGSYCWIARKVRFATHRPQSLFGPYLCLPDWLKKDLGVDEVINYHDQNTASKMLEALKKACPSGIDIYFDNTGGYTTDAVFHHINLRARIIICGQISQYNGGLDNPELGPRFLHIVLYKRCTIQVRQTRLFREFEKNLTVGLGYFSARLRD